MSNALSENMASNAAEAQQSFPQELLDRAECVKRYWGLSAGESGPPPPPEFAAGWNAALDYARSSK